MKTHWKKSFNPDYFGAYCMPEFGNIVLTISHVKEEKVKGADGKDSICLVTHFSDKGVKPLITNVTNSKAISKVANSVYIEDWSGVRIQIYTEMVKAFGEVVEGVRVRPFAPKAAEKEVITPTSAKWAKAVESVKSGKATKDVIKKHYEISEEHLKQLFDEGI
jgi:hypothetical protein